MRTQHLIIVLLFIYSGLNAQTDKFNIKKNPICISDTAEFRYNSLNLTSVIWEYPNSTTIISSTPNGIGYQKVVFNNPGQNIVIAKATISGAQHSDTLVVKVSQLLETYVNKTIEFHPTATYILNMSASINNTLSIAPHQYTWTIDNQSSSLPQNVSTYSYTFNSEGSHDVKLNISDAGGCIINYDTIVNTVKLFDAPNVFTPNNDGQNDNFIVRSTGDIPFNIEIYDRSGSLVYKPNLIVTQFIWDGRNSAGLIVKPGVYFYVITPEDTSIEPLRGFVHVFSNEK